jgi:hypothetical protein
MKRYSVIEDGVLEGFYQFLGVFNTKEQAQEFIDSQIADEKHQFAENYEIIEEDVSV